jgi:hypothetical protein
MENDWLEMSTTQVMEVLRQSGPTTARSDQVRVECQSKAEQVRVENTALQELRRGYVHKVVSSKTDNECRVFVTFINPEARTL